MTDTSNPLFSTNESEQEPQVKQSGATRIIMFVGIAFGTLVLAFAGYLVYLIFSAPAPDSVGINGQSTTQLDDSLVPATMNFTVTADAVKDGSEVQLATATADVGTVPEGYFVSYQIDDKDKNIVANGVVKDNAINAKIILKEGENIFTLALQVSNGYQYSNWITGEPVTVSGETISGDNGSTGVNTNAKPAPAYFDTDWAKGTGGQANFEEALTAAWGATKITTAELNDLQYNPNAACMPINYVASIAPGEMYPPLPSKLPTGYKFKYNAGPSDGNNMQVQFFWCA